MLATDTAYRVTKYANKPTPCSTYANTSSVRPEIPHILGNPKIDYDVYNSPPPVPILSHINPAHAAHPLT